MLNKALREQNFHTIFLFRTFIYDVCDHLRKLNNNQFKHRFCVYRSQLMSSDERKSLKKHEGHFISINTFLSTTLDRSISLIYLGNGNPKNNLQKVLFEINVDPMKNTKVFADISKISNYEDEREVLFMLGSIFRLESVQHNNEDTWIIRMNFCNDDEHDFRIILEEMKQRNGKGPTNLRTLGKLMWNMGELNLAYMYYCRLINELSPNDFWLKVLYEDLMNITSQNHNLTESLAWGVKLHAINARDTPVAHIVHHGSNNHSRKFYRYKLDIVFIIKFRKNKKKI
jgi:hypothetical protein